jgi:hypothetical protein
MDALALLLSRLQFAFTISFHIIFPSFSIGLAAWLTILEALHLATGRTVYRVVFDFWLKIFGVAFGMGVVSGIHMAFQFGTNWEVLARMTGPIQGFDRRYRPTPHSPYWSCRASLRKLCHFVGSRWRWLVAPISKTALIAEVVR